MVLELRGLRRSFGDRVALEGMTLGLRPGDRVALVGPNGAGKSTVLRLCAGVLLPDAGCVEVLGQDPCSVPAVRARIGYLSHESVLEPDETVAELVSFHHAMRGGGDPGPGDLRDELGLGDCWTARTGGLSRGYGRRTELACVLAGGPALVLLDEPLAGLDAEQRQGLAARVLRLAPQAAILLATHEPGDLEALWKRVVPMEDGRIVEGAGSMD